MLLYGLHTLCPKRQSLCTVCLKPPLSLEITFISGTSAHEFSENVRNAILTVYLGSIAKTRKTSCCVVINYHCKIFPESGVCCFVNSGIFAGIRHVESANVGRLLNTVCWLLGSAQCG